MFQVANNSKSDPIHIDAPAHVVNVFLNLASVSEPFPLETDFEDTAKLFELCDTIECAAIKRRVRERLNVLGALDPWRQLAFASEQDEIVMARVALRKMPSDPIVTLGTMTDLWSRPATLRAHWQLELLGRIMVKPMETETDPPGFSFAPRKGHPASSFSSTPGVKQTAIVVLKGWGAQYGHVGKYHNSNVEKVILPLPLMVSSLGILPRASRISIRNNCSRIMQ